MMTVPNGGNENEYQRAGRAFNVKSGARRQPPLVTVATTGHSKTNVSGTELMLPYIAAAQQDAFQCTVAFDILLAKGHIKVTVVKSGEVGAIPARLSKDKRSMSFHLGGVFADYPQLRATFDRQCPLLVDDDGSLVIGIASGVAARTARGTQSGPTAPPSAS